MPASENDPLSFALSNSFKSKSGSGSSSYVSHKMESSLSKSLLVNVEFDDPVVYKKSEIKSSYIVLTSNTRPGNANSTKEAFTNGHSESGACSSVKTVKPASSLDQVPAPKLTLYRKEQIQVGYNRMTGPGAGMKNMGNTCYLNSTLQALFHIPALVNYLSSGGHDKECSISGFSSCTICVMNSTLRQSHQSSVIKPIRIYEKLKLICKHLVHGRQEDAHEFLRYLIESLQRCYLISRKVPKTLENYSKETTPFNQIFGGYLRQELHCLKCRHISITFQHFMDLMLDIRNADNIESALTGYFKRETLSQEDMYKCEKCQQKVPAYKIYRIERPPLVLCIQLKRFHMMGGKNGRPVTLARNLDITRFIRWAAGCSLSFTYTLTSLITHVGPSPNCGHYTAIGQSPNGTYYRFDDDSVNPTSVQNVLNTSAYVIFYEMTRTSRDRYLSALSNTNSATTSAVTSRPEPIIGPQLPKLSSSSPSNNLSKPVPSTSRAGLAKSMVNGSTPGSMNAGTKADDQVQDRTKQATSRNMPCLISSPIEKSIDKERVKFGVVVPNRTNASGLQNALPAHGLVPDYGDGSSSDDDQVSKSKENQISKLNVTSKTEGSNNHLSSQESSSKHRPDILPSKNGCTNSSEPSSSKSLFPGIRTPFLPRAVAANMKKSHSFESTKSRIEASGIKTDTMNIYDEQDLENSSDKTTTPSDVHTASTSSSGMQNINAVNNSIPTLADMNASSIGIGANSSQERHGFTVSDKEAHNPSIHSDNSSGSTVSFTVSDVRPGSAGTNGSSSSMTGSSSRQGWNVVSVKRDRSDEESATEPNDEINGSPVKKSKLKEESKKSVLDDVKTKTTETIREFSKDFMSAGLKLKQQFEMKSSKVTDKFETISKNIEDIIPKFEEPSTSCEASTSQGGSKVQQINDIPESEPRKKNKKKKKKKKKNERSRSRSRSLEKQKEKIKGHRNRSRSKSNDRSPVKNIDRTKDENLLPRQENRTDDVRHSSWDRSAPVKRWDSSGKNEHRGRLDRSATWDGSKSSASFLDQIKRSSTIRSWGGDSEKRDEDNRERKRSVSPASDQEEMDRGRVKKVKKKKDDRRLPYNPFQVVQNIKERGGASYLIDKYKKRNHSYSGYRNGDSGGHSWKEKNRDYYKSSGGGGARYSDHSASRFNDHSAKRFDDDGGVNHYHRKDHRSSWQHSNHHRN